METRFEQLSEKSSYRRQRLLDSNQLFNFFREADEVESWIADKESIAMSDDYGRDIEHVETLLKKFEDFTRDLVPSGGQTTLVSTYYGTKNQRYFSFREFPFKYFSVSPYARISKPRLCNFFFFNKIAILIDSNKI